MINSQPYHKEKAKGRWQRKLSAAFVAASLLWLPVDAANAAITDTVVATGTNPLDGTPLTSSSTANVTVVPASPQLSVIKTPTTNFGPDASPDPGDTISYTFTIQNTGNITLKDVDIADPGATLTGIKIPLLAPGAIDTTSFTAVHVITIADLQAGKFVNTATGTAHALSGQDLSTVATVTTPLLVISSMTLKKTGTLVDTNGNGQTDAGETISYQFLVTNTGPTTLHDVMVDDPKVKLGSIGNNPQAVAMLAGAKQASDTISTASTDVPGWKISIDKPTTDITTKPAEAIAVDPPYAVVDDVSLNVDRQILRMSGTSDTLTAGDKIGFIYRLTNSGNLPLTSIVAEQPDATAFNARVELLGVNETDPVGMIFTRIVTDDEIAKGEIDAPATVKAKSKAHILNLKVADKLSLKDIKSYDSFTSASIMPTVIPVLPAGQQTIFTATHILTQADIDAGLYSNTATATALNVANQTLTSTDSVTITLPPVPGIATIKTGTIVLGADNQASVGDIITYHFAVTNTGNVTLKPVTLTDGGAVFTGTATIATLAPGQTDNTLIATHALTAADVTAGQYQNQSKANGKTPTNVAIPATNSDKDADHTTLDPTIVQWPAIALIKTVSAVNDVNGNGFTDAGDTISYAFQVINTGKFTLNNITVTDPLMPTGISGAPLNGLAPGASDSTHFTGLYTIKQSDVNLGHIDNTAKVEGTDTNGVKVVDFSDPDVPTADAPTITPIPPHPVLTLIKTQSSLEDKNNNGQTDVGDIIHYTFTITNAGNLPFTTVKLTDLLPGAIVSGTPLTNFAPNAQDSTTYTAAYTITANDVKLGSVSNQAKVVGTLASGGTSTDLSDNADPTLNNPTVTPIKIIKSIALIKHIFSIVDTNANAVTDAGDTINYTFDVKNTGNVPLTNVTITDLLAGAVVTGGPIANFPAGNTDTTTFKASYVLTATDITNGKVSNSAQVFGTYNTETVTDISDNSSFTSDNPTVATLGSGIGLVKTFVNFTDVNGLVVTGTIQPGDFINYAFVVSNIGSGDIKNITISDPIAIVSGGTLPILAAGTTNSTFFTAKHKIVQADIDAGGVYNQATAAGTSVLTNGPVTDTSDPVSKFGDAPTFTPISSTPGIALIKTLASFDDNNDSGDIDAGDVLHYQFDVVNTGNVALTDVYVTDALPNAVVTPFHIANLPAGGTDNTTISATYLVTIKDGKAGQVSNSATVNAALPTGGFVEDISDNTNVNGNAPTITPVKVTIPVLTKVADKPEVKRGEIVTYTITASNLPPATFNLVDVMPPGFTYVVGSATINNPVPGTPILATVSGRNLSFPAKTPIKGKLILKLKLVASSTLSTGAFVNIAQLFSDGDLLETAQATVTITPDATFDCSDIIGRVFDDKNANGYMDDGEPGLPGVRVVTLNGMLITTDAEGRYHVPCGAIPDAAIGSNFLMKLDVRTLPTGYKLTTENPRDVRVTRGKVVKLNFGATINHEVRLDITGKAFVGGSLDLTDAWIGGIDKLIAILAAQRSTLKIVYHQVGEDPAIANARVSAIEETISTAWQMSHGEYQLVTTTSVEEGK